MVAGFVKEWQSDVNLVMSLSAVLFTKNNTVWLIIWEAVRDIFVAVVSFILHNKCKWKIPGQFGILMAV